jgi:hypothetical protein
MEFRFVAASKKIRYHFVEVLLQCRFHKLQSEAFLLY